ncbi:unnamed protein product [Pelagomonas calceolata]|uniref:FAD/NAD(P)-binding domain-containing protein n=1 Tax=Pelagomonas calceolata TaxID=35677 RepID=A0A7S3ZX09_9STRA|nr:unnamed protein product [Pelagomonas calceolata]|mmetsp:Transcript_10851/g.32031  ORF Transcript_10851/g.32031 Transcript_10851/m.32031 type:complete len:614 (-) Transcript_10851:381-2222(-)
MVPRSKKMGTASQVATEFVAPTPSSVNNTSKTTRKETTSPETTYCQYLGSLVTKLDRVARIPKLLIDSAKSMSDVMLKPGPRQKVLIIRTIAGFISMVPHLLWMSFLFASVMYFGVPWLWLLYFVVAHHSIVFLNMLMFPLRRSKQHAEKILIVGGGLSGIRCAVELLANGYTPTIVEKTSAYGGTWNANDYPGCKSDVATSSYLFSKWFVHFRLRCCAHSYSLRSTSRWYAQAFARYAGLERLTRFNCEVQKLTQQTAGGYDVLLKSTSSACGYHEHYDYVIFAMGPLTIPKMISSESQHVIHASAMTEAHSRSLKGKNVFIVGAACSGTQMVGPLMKQFGARSVTLCAPRGQWFGPGTSIENPVKPLLDFLMQFLPLGSIILRAWSKKNGANFAESMQTGTGLEILSKYTRACYQMTGLDSLIPTHSVQGTRTIMDYDFFNTVYHNPASVKYVKGRVASVKEGKNGATVEINGQSHFYDFVIMATGFDTDLSPRFASMGLEVDIYKNFFGICIKNLPDCFFLVGPNTGSKAQSITLAMEIQSRAIVKLLNKQASIPDAWYDEFSKWIVEKSPIELTACKSWYTNGTGRNFSLFPGSYQEYEQRLDAYLSRI